MYLFLGLYRPPEVIWIVFRTGASSEVYKLYKELATFLWGTGRKLGTRADRKLLSRNKNGDEGLFIQEINNQEILFLFYEINLRERRGNNLWHDG